MNKKHERTDRERDQSRRLEQGEAMRKKRQGGMPGQGQQQAGDEPRRQQGGWMPGEERGQERGNRPRNDRDDDSGEKIVDEP